MAAQTPAFIPTFYPAGRRKTKCTFPPSKSNKTIQLISHQPKLSDISKRRGRLRNVATIPNDHVFSEKSGFPSFREVEKGDEGSLLVSVTAHNQILKCQGKS